MKASRTVQALMGFALCFVFSPAALAGSVTAVPCPAKAKAVIANVGQSIHNAGSSVTGDVQAGQSIVHNGGSISGTQTPNTPAGLAVVPVPANAVNLGAVTITGTRNFTAGNYVASSLQMNSGSSITVSGGVVQIWVTGALIIKGPANSGGNPENLEFLITGTQDAHVNSVSSLYGFIYAPNANVFVDSVVHGSVVGKATTLNSGGQVVFEPGAMCPNIPTGSCAPANSLTTLVSGSNVTAYIPKGSWSEIAVPANTGVKLVSLEGAAVSTTIPTTSPVNSCAGNSVTGKVVCTSNITDVYVINGSAVTNTLTSGASTTPQSFSGGSCRTCGVAIDAVHNTAAITLGLSLGGGYQMMDLATNTLQAPIAAGAGLQTSEDILIDPQRNLILSPNESNIYQVVGTTGAHTVSNFTPSSPPLGGEMDSAAEDCSTGIALSSVEFTNTLLLTNLNAATFSGTSWSAPSQFQAFPEFSSFANGTDGIAVDSSTHFGLVTGEFGGGAFGVIQLPAAPVAGVPAVLDYAAANIPNTPGNIPWASGFDPHTLTVYKSPTSNRAFGVMQNSARTFLAVIDLQALLAAPRVAGTHNVQAGFDLISNNVLRFVALPA